MGSNKNMLLCIVLTLIFLIGFAGNAIADTGGGGGGLLMELTPLASTNPVGTEHTVTALLMGPGGYEEPISGLEVTFNITAGPHEGLTYTTTTNDTGQATFTYQGTYPGTDVIKIVKIGGIPTTASHLSHLQGISVSKTWISDQNRIPEFPTIALPIVAILGLALLFQRRKE